MATPSWMLFVSHASLNGDKKAMMEIGSKQVEYSGLPLSLETHYPFCEVSG